MKFTLRIPYDSGVGQDGQESQVNYIWTSTYEFIVPVCTFRIDKKSIRVDKIGHGTQDKRTPSLSRDHLRPDWGEGREVIEDGPKVFLGLL